VIKEPDEALVARCRNGDGSAFTVLVGRYQGPIYNAAYRVLGNAEDASDITQSVFLRIAERLDDYDSQFKFFSWIYRIALNESLNLLRSNGREQPLGDDEDLVPDDAHADPESQALGAELSARVQRALMKLKAQDRMVLVLRHFSECSYREIAVVLEIDEKTVKSRLFEARSRMRGLLHEVHAA
jgi:RNA polymerase sigma-70 factor (ECF subfamily)